MRIALLLVAGVAAACSSAGARSGPAAAPVAETSVIETSTVAETSAIEAYSLLGEPLESPRLSPELLASRTTALHEAEAMLDRDPSNADALIWVGRRLAYLGRYREAIDVFTHGIELHPDDARMFRHRGHRFITLRELDRATADLSRAALLVEGLPDQIEPDGLPNARNVPTSTLQSNIWYHLGLARYLSGDFEAALAAYHNGMQVSRNPDGLVSMSYWYYLTLRRLGRNTEAAALLEPITPELDVIENQSYHRLLQLYRGERQMNEILSGTESSLDDATTGYGAGIWLLLEGDRQGAMTLFERITASPEWAAFGFIAAEAELARDGQGYFLSPASPQ